MNLYGPYWISHCAASALLGVLLGTANAAESSAGAPLPGLTADEGSDLSAQSCAVTLSGRKAAVELELSTSSDHPALLLSGPRFGWLGESEAYPDRHFPELEIRIDGTLISPEDRFDAFVGKRDISLLIREAGIDPWAISRTPPIVSAAKDAWTQKLLERSRAVQRSGDDYLAQWTARRMLRIPLKAAPKQRLQLSYLARPAFTQLSSAELLMGGRDILYCLSPKQINAKLHMGTKPRSIKIVEYSIATGIDGHPAPTVTLTASNDAATAEKRVFRFACGPYGKSIAAAGNLTRQPVQVDLSGNLRVLEVTEP